MNKAKIKEVLIVICISYTVISIGIALFESIFYQTDRNLSARLMILLFTSIAVCILYTHPLLERFSPLLMVLIQYAAAMALVFLSIWISSFFEELHKDSYFDAFRSFTVIYLIGAAVYYIEVHLAVRKQNRMLEDIRRMGSGGA